MSHIGVYPGSFDPFTVGHLDVLLHAVSLFETVHLGVLRNNAKSPVFTTEERVAMIERVIEAERLSSVRVASFDGLLVDYVASIGAKYIIRGLRAITDFDYEFQIAALNRRLNREIRTVYFMASPEHSFLSSSAIREIGVMGGNIEGLVPPSIHKTIAERLTNQ